MNDNEELDFELDYVEEDFDDIASEDELEEEKHDPKDAEEQSVDATEKAGDGVKKQAPKRKGDNSNAMPPQKMDRKGMLTTMVGKLESLKGDSLVAMYKKVTEDLDLEEVEVQEYAFDEELKELVESEATLSDEFKAKSAVIFETAIRSKIAEEVNRLEDEYETKLEEGLTETREDLVEKVDNYLNYVVENWMKENELQIETGLRAEIAEDFMEGLKELFTESYIDVPESKIDVVDELALQVDETEEKLNEATAAVIELSNQLESYKREDIVREHSSDLAETEIEKLRKLVSSLDFEDEEMFSEKVKTVKESYFKKSSSTEQVIDDLEEDWDEEVSSSASMQKYLDALKKTQTNR